MKSSREQFEEWFYGYTSSAPGRCKILRSGIGYRNIACQEQWEAWQASRAEIEVELPTVIWDMSEDGSQHYDRDDVIDAIQSAGLKVKS